jgi:hypothetical protein
MSQLALYVAQSMLVQLLIIGVAFGVARLLRPR